MNQRNELKRAYEQALENYYALDDSLLAEEAIAAFIWGGNKGAVRQWTNKASDEQLVAFLDYAKALITYNKYLENKL